jgi:rare lipoprotein A
MATYSATGAIQQPQTSSGWVLYARVTNRSNGRHVFVRINDRMGNDKRLIDLTVAATEQLDFKREGTTHVKVKVVKPGKGRRKIRRQG